MAEDHKTQQGRPGGSPAPTGSQTSYLPPAADPLVGKTVAGRYMIEKQLGEGGMGTVYLATHTILEKQVALKVLHGELGRKPELVERFMQEAKAASRIRHENVIDISDFGSTPEGLVFFAMELLQGHDLHEEITRARRAGHLLPWERSKKIFLQVCAALSAAHARGIVHRDLKPENVYLVEFLGDPDFVKLLDFGIAKLTEVSEEGGRKLTKTGMLFGTPEYMSPEQARGEPIDHRVDVYAMGCILFQLVSGRVPFAADSFMGVLSLHLTEQPPAIAPEVFDQIGAPRELADVIDRALAKDRDARWQTIDDLANAVRAVCGDPAPGERTPSGRIASVPAPAKTTRPRPATQQTRPSGRQKTAWTGKLAIPEVPVEVPPEPPSKRPIAIGAGLAVVVAAAAGFFMLRGGGRAGAPVDAGAAATPAITGSSAGAAVTPAPAPAPAPPALPAMATIDLDSAPHGARVTDLTTGKVIGKTPVHFSLPGSSTARQFALHLHGYTDATVELKADRATIAYTEQLARGASAGRAVVHHVPEPAPDVTSSGAITHPDTSTAVTRPDVGPVTTPTPPATTKPAAAQGSAAAKPDTAKPEAKAPPAQGSAATKPQASAQGPATGKPKPAQGSATAKPKAARGSAAAKPAGDDCPDDTQPCLKRHIPGLAGSGS